MNAGNFVRVLFRIQIGKLIVQIVDGLHVFFVVHVQTDDLNPTVAGQIVRDGFAAHLCKFIAVRRIGELLLLFGKHFIVERLHIRIRHGYILHDFIVQLLLPEIRLQIRFDGIDRNALVFQQAFFSRRARIRIAGAGGRVKRGGRFDAALIFRFRLCVHSFGVLIGNIGQSQLFRLRVQYLIAHQIGKHAVHQSASVRRFVEARKQIFGHAARIFRLRGIRRNRTALEFGDDHRIIRLRSGINFAEHIAAQRAGCIVLRIGHAFAGQFIQRRLFGGRGRILEYIYRFAAGNQ